MLYARIVFSGRVQGVGFRQHVSDMAMQEGVLGTVQNAPDGTVVARIEAKDAKAIDSFMSRVSARKAGFSLIRVDSAKVSEMYEKKEGDFASFEII